ncbi:MAG TPA: SET domain-containing protein [Kofleriaceae bacterium]|nr:SET domain-containing protein [Kofleriaceae bacterium]
MTSFAASRLTDWAREAGAQLEPIEIRADGGGSRGLFTRRDVRAGELLMRIPKRMVITHEVMVEMPACETLGAFEGKLHSQYVMHAVWLGAERGNVASPWRAYLEALPASFAYMPTLRTDEDLAALDGTRALEMVLRRRQELRADLTVVTDLLDEARDIPRGDMIWGNHAARSRGFKMPDGSRPALVPVADMANHGAPNATFDFVDGGDFEVRATADLAVGVEVLHSYGQFSNARWLAGYGFALPDNPDDEVVLELDGSPVFIGAADDDRMTIARSLAARELGRWDDDAIATTIASAARRAADRIAAAPLPAESDAAWRATCELVRAGERAVLSANLSNLTNFTPSP